MQWLPYRADMCVIIISQCVIRVRCFYFTANLAKMARISHLIYLSVVCLAVMFTLAKTIRETNGNHEENNDDSHEENNDVASSVNENSGSF